MLLFSLPILVSAQEVDSLDSDTTSEFKRFAIYPALGYSPETEFTFGTIAFIVFEDKKKDDNYHRPSSLTPLFLYTTKKQMLIKSELDIFLLNGDNLNVDARYFNFPDVYYGIGNDTDADVSELFTDQFFKIDGRFYRPITSKLFVGFNYDVQFNNIKDIIPGGLLASDAPNGINGGWNVGVGAGLQYDSRNSTLYPTKGKQFIANAITYKPFLGGDYNYTKYVLDYRQYFEFLGPKNIVAFQFSANMTGGGDIPFYKLNAIAGDSRLRGIQHRNLYKDNNAMFFQVEGRQHIFWRFGGVLFAGVGQAFESFSSMTSEDFRFVYGLGGRFQAMRDQKLNLRMDVGFSDQGQYAFYLSVREAF